MGQEMDLVYVDICGNSIWDHDTGDYGTRSSTHSSGMLHGSMFDADELTRRSLGLFRGNYLLSMFDDEILMGSSCLWSIVLLDTLSSLQYIATAGDHFNI